MPLAKLQIIQSKYFTKLFNKKLFGNIGNLPHFSLRITEPICSLTQVIIFISLLIIILSNLMQDFIFKPGEEKSLVYQILQNPSDYNHYDKLGSYYYSIGKKDMAEKNYIIAEELFKNQNSIDRDNSPWQKWLEKKNKKANMEKELDYWNNVSSNFPDYIYAKIKLAALHHLLNQHNEANNLLNHVLNDDPTNKEANRLIKMF